jgi:small subunit ribosomal protein S13
MGSDQELKRLEAKIRKKEQGKDGQKAVKSSWAKGEKVKGKEDKTAEKPRPKKGELRAAEIIRLAETNLDGTKRVCDAIRSIRGVSFMMGNAISRVSGLGSRKLGDLSEQEKERLEEMIMHPERHGIPAWMCNRKRDPATGKDMHLAVSELEFTQKMDIDLMRKLKTYKGVRHSIGLPVRGQRTRGSFRKGKTVGVSKKKQAPSKSKKK